MSEMPAAGEHHREAVFVGGGDDFGVAHRAAGLHDGRRAGGRDASSPSRNGKNASDATTEPRSRSPPFITAAFTASTRLIWPGADRERRVRPGEDDGVRLHVRADAPGESQRPHSSAVGARRVTTRGTSGPATPPAASIDAIPRLHEPGAQNRPHVPRAVEPSKAAVTTRRFALVASTARTSSRSVDARRDHGLDERGRQRARRVEIDRPVEPDDAAERRERIGLARAHVRLGQRRRRSRRRTDSCA